MSPRINAALTAIMMGAAADGYGPPARNVVPPLAKQPDSHDAARLAKATAKRQRKYEAALKSGRGGVR
jgi:hypothetical protein